MQRSYADNLPLDNLLIIEASAFVIQPGVQTHFGAVWSEGLVKFIAARSIVYLGDHSPSDSQKYELPDQKRCETNESR
jgi:hypothetical protein